MNSKLLIDHFTLEEGLHLQAYKDHLGHWTIGIGHKLPSGKNWSGYQITKEQAVETLYRDLAWAFEAAKEIYPRYDSYPDNVQLAIVDMIFNLGEPGYRQFTTTIGLIKAGKFDEAADQALQSKWARQVPNRAKRITDLLRG